MANWSGFVLTDVGAKLQAKINAGLTTLKFTKLGIGSGSGSGSINALTAMVNKVQDINIGSVKANNNIVTINSTLTNKGLGSAYQMRELGLFATDPDVGEILFAYMTDNTPDTMPADGSATVVSQDITLNITFSNTGKVSATIDTGAFVTHEDLNTHTTSSSAHADIRQLFKNYLPLTGGTLTGGLNVNDAVIMGGLDKQFGNFIEKSKAGTMYLASGKSESSNLSWFNVDGYFKYPNTAEMCVIKRDENSNIVSRAFLLDQDNKTRFPNEVYANEKLLATKEYVDLKKWGSKSITDGAVTPTKLDRPYLPLTGGAVTGKLHVDDLVSTGNNTMQFSNFIQTSLAGKAYLATGKSQTESWYNIDGYFNNPEKSNISAIKRKANGDVIARAFLLHADNKTYFPNEVYSNEKLLATKEYVDTKGTNDLSAHNTSNSAHSDIRRMFESYLPLTGGTLTGGLNITYGSGNPVHSIRSGGGSTLSNLDVGSAKNTTKVALSCLERPAWYNDTVGSNDLALLKDLNWKKLYSVNRAAFVMPARGTALCDIPSTWKELHITWIWTHETSTINNVVGYNSYTANIINGAIADPIIFIFPDSEGALVVKNNKLYVIDRGQSADGAPVLIMWR